MISRNRSTSTAAAMSIECTTSANSTVTCLYFAVSRETAVEAPHSSQNLALSRMPVPHDPHATSTVIRPSHRLGPVDVAFEAKRCRHRTIAPHQVPVGHVVAAGPRQQSSEPQQPDVAYHQTLIVWRGG